MLCDNLRTVAEVTVNVYRTKDNRCCCAYAVSSQQQSAISNQQSAISNQQSAVSSQQLRGRKNVSLEHNTT